MSTDLVHAPASDLAITADQTFWTDKQRAALVQLGVANAHNADLAVFFHQVVRTGLDPFLKQIYMIERDGKQTIQTGIDGFRLIARRAVDQRRETLGYEDTLWCGADGDWKQVWLDSEPPYAAAVVALRNGNRFPAIALYNEYVVKKRDGKPNRVWAGRPAGQLEKCAEALALRKAFPQDLSGLYTSDEMKAEHAPEATWDAEVVEEHVETNPDQDELPNAFPDEAKP
jgi:phage recombination protein Bet